MESARRKLPPNPREKANFFSIMWFVWTLPLFRKGYGKVLLLEDIFQPLKCDRSESLGDRLDVNWSKQLKNSKRPSLVKAILRTLWREYSLLALYSFFNDVVLRLGQPLLLGKLLQYFRKDSTMTFENAMYYASGMLFLNAVMSVTFSQFVLLSGHISMKMRVAVCSIVYRKALRLSQTALVENAPGKVVNLLSNDANRFDWVCMFQNALWSGPLITLIAAYLLWIEVGWPGIIGIAIVFLVVPLQSYLSKFTSKFRLQTALKTDDRIRFMDEIICGVQVIKMYAWEWPFAQLIAYARKMELKIIRKTSYIRALFMTFMMFTTRMAIFCTMLSIALLYGSENITAAKVFVISSYFATVSQIMSATFVRAISEGAETLVALRRLQNFLEYSEKGAEDVAHNSNGIFDDKPKKQNPLESENRSAQKFSISIKNVSARWVIASAKKQSQQNGHVINESKTKMPFESAVNDRNLVTLQNLDIELPQSKLIGIVGPVGAGKSSLLQLLLRELPLESGSLNINGTIAYASQEPWVFAGSVRQNILFGQEYDRERYDAVVKTCALVKDFEQLENGDRTVIGDRGASLSGGQKARVNLARAAYRKADIYLLDDPLSAVDAHVGQHLFNQCIGPHGQLARQRSTRILVTHQVHFLKDADWIVVLRDGQIEVQGSPDDLSRSGIDFAKLIGTNEKQESDDKLSRQISRQTSRQISRRISGQISRKSSTGSRSSTSQCSDDGSFELIEEIEEEQITVEMEASSKNAVKGSLLLHYFKAGANLFLLVGLFVLFIATQSVASLVDFWVSIWTKQEEIRAYNQTQERAMFTEMPQEVLNGTFLTEAISKIDDSSFSFSTNFCIYVHGGLMLCLFIIGISRSIGFYGVCIGASQNLHGAMFKGLISTKMRFFDTNSSGRILNRFSKDMGSIDELLPKAILDATQVGLVVLGAIVVTSIVNPFLLIPVAALALIFILTRRIYLKTSRNVKRLEGISKSPMYTHLSATLNGLSTIRAFNAEKVLQNEFDAHQDTHTACWFMFLAIGGAFGMTLDIMCLIFLLCVVYSFMLFDTGISGDKVGLAITQVMALNGILQWGMRQSAEVSNQVMSVERVLEYRDLEPEKQPQKPLQVEKDWPSKGQIEFRNVVYRYFAEADPVLRGLTFVIQPMEKIGIVGRTGAGKSSLIGAIFRLACIEGEILIDGIDTSTLQLSDLRSRVAIIPQDPVLFSGTLRKNLDPFEEYSDSDVWSALEEVELKEVASGPLGLQSAVMANGSNFSVGQRQLLCLARAILRKNRILVLDEATANVDPQTDLLIQQTIREKFAECTVLTVAHRLHTIIDSDRVLVMDFGEAVEFDEPHNLLQLETGIFKDMVKALGPQEYTRLSRAALDTYHSKLKNI